MSYNGSGTFQINTSGQPVVTNTVISSTAFNALTADLATGLSTAITKDGQTSTTVRIPFAQGITSTLVTDSTSTSTGSIITAGGVGIAKNAYIGGNANIAGTLDVTGVTTVQAGTAAAPAITTTGDTNTGIFFPVADTIAFSKGGAEAMRINSSGNVLVVSAAGLGYGTGSGGTVTQATSKGNSVTLNKPTGQITMNAAALAGGGSVGFTLSNSLLAATDNLLMTFVDGSGTTAVYTATPQVLAGAAFIVIRNTSGISYSEAIKWNFAIIKGATS